MDKQTLLFIFITYDCQREKLHVVSDRPCLSWTDMSVTVRSSKRITSKPSVTKRRSTAAASTSVPSRSSWLVSRRLKWWLLMMTQRPRRAWLQLYVVSCVMSITSVRAFSVVDVSPLAPTTALQNHHSFTRFTERWNHLNQVYRTISAKNQHALHTIWTTPTHVLGWCSVVCLSVCLSVTLVSHAKSTKPIEMAFVMLTRVNPTNYILYRGAWGAT